jgi:hypothetical protein
MLPPVRCHIEASDTQNPENIIENATWRSRFAFCWHGNLCHNGTWEPPRASVQFLRARPYGTSNTPWQGMNQTEAE